MTEKSSTKGFWKTLPGIITAIAGAITAITGLLVALNQIGVFSDNNQHVSSNASSTREASSKTGDRNFVIEDPSISQTKLTAWQLGHKLGLVAALRSQGVESEVNRYFVQSLVLARELGLRELSLPERTGRDAEDSAIILGYILQDQEGIHYQLSRQYGEEHAQLYQLAAKSMLVAILYSPEGGDLLISLIRGIQRAAIASGLPDNLWTPLLDKMSESSSYSIVKEELFQMHNRTENYLRVN